MGLVLLHDITSYGCSVLSIILNIILIILIFKKTPKSYYSYSQILLQNCLTDLFFAFVTLITVEQTECFDGKLFFRPSAFRFPKGILFSLLAGIFFIIGLYTTIWSLVIQVLFRYFCIVRKRTLSCKQLWLLQFFIIFFVIGITIVFGAISVGSTKATSPTPSNNNSILLQLDTWKDYPQAVTDFQSMDINSPIVLSYLLMASAISVTIFVTFIVLNLRIRNVLKNQSSLFSSKTLKMHKQFSRRTLLQSILPCIAFIGVAGNLTAIYLSKYSSGGNLLLGIMAIHLLIVWNPIVTLLTIQAYRNALFCKSSKENYNQQQISPLKSNFVTVAAITNLN